MDANVEVDRLLASSGAVLLRHNKHLVYGLPNGKTFVRSKTPSDRCSGMAHLTILRRMLKTKGDNDTMQIDVTIPEPVRQLLQRHGAIPAGECAWRLPNGVIFQGAKIRKHDQQAASAQLAKLTRLLEAPVGPATNGHATAATQAVSGPPPPVVQAVMPAPAQEPQPEPPPQQPEGLKARIEARIAKERAEQERLLDLAGRHDQTVKMLSALVEYADTPGAEAILAGLGRAPAPPAPPPAPAAPPPPPPPQFITDRVQVNRELVHIATQALEGDFRVDDIYRLMTADRQIDAKERQRIRSSIVGAVYGLMERGEIKQTQKGIGKRPAFFQRVLLKGVGPTVHSRG